MYNISFKRTESDKFLMDMLKTHQSVPLSDLHNLVPKEHF